MRSTTRLVISFIALAWIAGMALWGVWDHTTHHILGRDVSAARWERARQASAQLPIRWRAGAGRPPLLPVSGEVIVRGQEVTLNDGLVLVPGTFAAERVGIRVVFERTTFDRYPGLEGPLLPFLGKGAESHIRPAQKLELCAGVADPTKVDTEGLRLRWDTSERLAPLGVYRGSADAPLFPGKALRLDTAPDGRSSIAMTVDGNHILGYVNDELLLDFHTTVPVTGAVGIGAYEGVIRLCEIELYVPE